MIKNKKPINLSWWHQIKLAIEYLGKSASIKSMEQQLLQEIIQGIVYCGWQVKKHNQALSNLSFWYVSQAQKEGYLITPTPFKEEHYLFYRNWKNEWILQVQRFHTMKTKNKINNHDNRIHDNLPFIEEYQSLSFIQLEKLLLCSSF
jgi:hypothetical protein